MKLASTTKLNKGFMLGSESYNYFYHDYNTTWGNERTVEIPIIQSLVQEHLHDRILELGNVLSHYFNINHKVVDKYEREPGVVNQDIVDFDTPERYNLIVSISTIEHIGWDEKPRDSDKPFRALKRLRSLLDTGGEICYTVPIGSNPSIDKAIGDDSNRLADSMRFLRRLNFANEWAECNREEALKLSYGDFKYSHNGFPPYPHANAVMVGVIANSRCP